MGIRAGDSGVDVGVPGEGDRTIGLTEGTYDVYYSSSRRPSVLSRGEPLKVAKGKTEVAVPDLGKE